MNTITTIATSVEQSKELLELGIDPNTASMSYDRYEFKGKSGYTLACTSTNSPFPHKDAIPAWTLGNLIEFLPDEITKDGQKYTLSIGKDEISYIYINTQRIVPVACLCNFEGNLIDAAVEAIKAVKKLMS